MRPFRRSGDRVASNLRPAEAFHFSKVEVLLEASCSCLLSPDYSPNTLARAVPLLTRGVGELLSTGTFYVVEGLDGQFMVSGGWSKAFPRATASVPGLAHPRYFATHPYCLRRGIARSIFIRCRDDAQREDIESFICISSLSAAPFLHGSASRAFRPLIFDLPLISR